MNVLLVIPHKKGFSTDGLQSLGIGMIAAVLVRAGHEVKVLDLTVDQKSPQEFGEFVRQAKPDLVGFTAVSPTVELVYYQLAPQVYANSTAKIVVGGPHPTALPEDGLDILDFVARGEGELTIVELCANGLNPKDVQGLSYRSNGKITHNPPREFISDLDALPFPARELFPPLTRYRGLPSLGNKAVGNISTSRGCYGRCAFCSNAIFGRRCRFRSAASVVEEWEVLIRKHGAEVITMSDDHFSALQKRVVAICELLEKKKLTRTPWTCSNGIRVEAATPELLKVMRRAGCCAVAFGIESGAQEVLDKMEKHITLEKIRNAVKNARAAGISTITGFFILGTPWDTGETMRRTIDFAKSLPLDYAQFTIAMPFPGTAMREEVKDRLLDIPYSEYGAHEGRVYFETDQLPKDVVLDFFSKAYREFYMRPSLVLRHARRVASNPSLFGNYLRGAKRFILPRDSHNGNPA
jgi:radical SAM superfamily enzyme YgiQ (UPF0313 family)